MLTDFGVITSCGPAMFTWQLHYMCLPQTTASGLRCHSVQGNPATLPTPPNTGTIFLFLLIFFHVPNWNFLISSTLHVKAKHNSVKKEG